MMVKVELFHGKGNRVLPWSDEDEDSHEGQAGRGSGASQEESIGQPGLGEPGHEVGIGFDEGVF